MPTSADPSGPPTGRRERNKHDKRERILDAATRLFAARGFSAVTTGEIAEAADIGAGTLFRYVHTKAELLLLVINEQLRLGTDAGLARAVAGGSATDAILELLAPLARTSLGHPENAVIYQRETLFGADGPNRARAVARVGQLEDAILEILRVCTAGQPVDTRIDLADVAHVVYSTMYMDIVRVGVGRAAADDLPARLRRTVDLLVHGLLDPHRTTTIDAATT